MQYELIQTSQFKKDIKRILKRSKSDFDLTFDLIRILTINGVEGLSRTTQPHRLKGKYRAFWECHIKPDLILIWSQSDDKNIIILVRIGSHSDLFK
jgi:mRNA interferase YafQ